MKRLFLLFLLPFAANAQGDPSTYPVATITTEHCVQLDANLPVSDLYQINIAPFGFSTFEAAYNVFGMISNNLLTYTVDILNQKAILEVHLDRTDVPQDIVWWNNYLQSLCAM